MRQVLGLSIPEAGQIEQPGEIARNDKLFIHLGHELLQKFHFLGVGVLVLDGVLPCGRIGRAFHVAGHGLVAEALPGADQALLGAQEGGGVGGRAVRVDHLGLVAGAHLHHHAGGQPLAGIIDPPVGAAAGRAPDAAPGGDGLFDEHCQTGGDPFLNRDGVDKLVDVPDAGQGVGHVRNFPNLAGSPLGVQEVGVFGVHVGRFQHPPALDVVLLYPVAHRPAPGVVLDAAHHPVPAAARFGAAHVQFVHLDGLELEGHQAAGGVPEQEQDAAVHLFALHRHAEDLGEGLFAGDVAVAGLAPLPPQVFDAPVEIIVARIRPQGIALAHHIALVGQDDGLQDVAVALQIARPGPDHVPAEPVGGLGALVDGGPVGVDAAVPGGIVVAQGVIALPPGLPLVGPLRGHGGDHIVEKAHPHHLPSKKAT